MKRNRLLCIIGIMIFVFTGCTAFNKEVQEESEEIVEQVSDNQTESENAVSENIPASIKEPDEVIEITDHDNGFDNETHDNPNPEEFESENHDAIQALVAEKYELLETAEGFDKTHDVYEINKKIAELNCYDFSDTYITFLGDSITYGLGGDYNEYNNLVSYVDYVRNILGCKTKNLGVSGACYGSYNGYEGFVYRVKEIPENTDIIVVFGGINDYYFGEELFGDENYEFGTYMGDTKSTYDQLAERFPDKQVYIVTMYSTQYEDTPMRPNSIPFSDYVQVQRVLAKEHGFNVIDINKYDLMNNKVFYTFAKYFNDKVHPNNEGYMWLGRYIAAEIVEDYN